jgi:hypothetical protein
MFNNFFGKRIKKFANIFWRNGVGTIEMSKEANILNNMAPGGKPGTSTENCLTEFDYNSICNKDAMGSNSIGTNNKILPISWSDKEKKKDEKILVGLSEINNSKNLKNPLVRVFSKYLERLDKRTNNPDSPKSENSANENELKSNKLKNRVCEVHISANNPREDRSNAIQLKNFDGYFLSVLDGHGGEDVADFAHRELHKKFDEKYKEIAHDENMREQQKVKVAMYYAFQEIVKIIFY